MKKSIFVNALAAKHGGAIEIVKQFLFFIKIHDVHNRYYIYCPALKELSLPNNVFLVQEPKIQTSWFYRLFWDIFGYRRWIKKTGLEIDLYVSFQNTGFWNTKPALVYYHQPIPLEVYSWSLFKPEQRVLWFYKNIYLMLIKLSVNKKTEFIVQAKWIKEKLSNKLGIAKDNVHVIRPSLALMSPEKVEGFSFNKKKINLFFPASISVYKNHKIIVEAIDHIRKMGLNYQEYLVHFTIFSGASSLYKLIRKLGLTGSFIFHGNITLEQVYSMYKSCDLVVFPSYIETFGLPLIEAAQFGKSIIAADCDYSRETLAGYSSASYVNPFDASKWAEAILKKKDKKCFFVENRYNSQNNNSDWSDFFRLLQKKIGQGDVFVHQ